MITTIALFTVALLLLFLFTISGAIGKAQLQRTEENKSIGKDNVVAFKPKNETKEYRICGTAADCPFKKMIQRSNGELSVCLQPHTDCPDMDSETIIVNDKEVL